jgi:hypothetical protein
MFRWTFDIYGFRMEVLCREEAAGGWLERIYGNFPDRGGAAPDCSLVMERRQDSWLVFEHGAAVSAPAATLPRAADFLERIVCSRLIAGRPDWVALHGALVSGAPEGIFLTGNSGAGKSTLCLALAACGFPVETDDYGLVDPGSYRVHPIPRCFHVQAGTVDLLGTVPFDPAAVLRGREILTPRDFGAAQQPVKIKAIIHLTGVSGAAGLQPVSQAEMLAVLCGALGPMEGDQAPAVRTMAGLVGSLSCFRLNRSSLAIMIAAVRPIIYG